MKHETAYMVAALPKQVNDDKVCFLWGLQALISSKRPDISIEPIVVIRTPISWQKVSSVPLKIPT